MTRNKQAQGSIRERHQATEGPKDNRFFSFSGTSKHNDPAPRLPNRKKGFDLLIPVNQEWVHIEIELQTSGHFCRTALGAQSDEPLDILLGLRGNRINFAEHLTRQ